jgi:hypothetical protein
MVKEKDEDEDDAFGAAGAKCSKEQRNNNPSNAGPRSRGSGWSNGCIRPSLEIVRT